MKKFLTKVLLYIGILLAIILPVSAYFFLKLPRQALLVSNSVSYNLKAGFIQQHPEKLRDAGLVIVGSSMSLNNLDACLLRDSFHIPTVNLGSWGLAISNYETSPIWDQPKIFLTNLGVPDFLPTTVVTKDNFSFNTSRLREFFNFVTDFRTFLSLLPQVKETMDIPDNRSYISCNFDDCGSVLFSDSGFNVTATRWEDDAYALFKMNAGNIANYIVDLKTLVRSHDEHARLMISFSPVRRKFYNRSRSEMVAKLGMLIRTNCPNVIFFNLYDRDYPDSQFADNCHFNSAGAKRYTRELVDSIRAYQLIK